MVQGLLLSMARIASACARLCWRREILDVDAALAIAFMEVGVGVGAVLRVVALGGSQVLDDQHH